MGIGASRSFAAVAAAVLSVALPLAGCGGDVHRDAVSVVAVRLLTAVQDGDGAAACAILAPDTVEELEQSAGGACPAAILDEDLPEPGEVTRVDVYGQWARVVLTGDTVFLAVFPDGWRVVAAGCAPRGERPYDCVVQGG